MSRGTLARLSLSARDRRALDETLADWPNADSGCIPGETATVEDMKGHGEELFFIPFIPFMVRAFGSQSAVEAHDLLHGPPRPPRWILEHEMQPPPADSTAAFLAETLP